LEISLARTIKQAVNNIGAKLKKLTTQKKLGKEIGTYLVTEIQRTARNGKVVDEEKLVQNPALLEKTIKRRKKLIKAGNPKGEKYRANKSNLTLTGQLLNSIRYTFKEGVLTIFVKKKRRPYKGVRGKLLKNDATNQDIIKGQAEKGRVIMALNKARSARIRGFIREALKRLRRL
jgi:hypothetical protein